MSITPLTGAQVQISTTWTGNAPGGNTASTGTLSNAIDISSWVQSVEWPEEAANLDYTNFGSAGYVQQTTGLKKAMVKFNVFQDYAASAIDQLVYSSPGSGLGSTFYVDIKPTSSSRSATNPSRVAQLVVESFSPVMAKVGELQVIQVSWPATGWFGRLTS